MILSFSTKINGKETYFVEKIHKSFRIHEVNMKAAIDPSIHYPMNYNFTAKDKLSAKIHTIREDRTNRWKSGVNIDFFINTRQKNMFRFAPVLPVVSIQSIEITLMHWARFGIYYETKVGKIFTIKVDGRYLSLREIIELSLNDGFDTTEDFFEYFNKDFKGKIIHWTDLRY